MESMAIYPYDPSFLFLFEIGNKALKEKYHSYHNLILIFIISKIFVTGKVFEEYEEYGVWYPSPTFIFLQKMDSFSIRINNITIYNDI
jgi:hypothetical protein